MLSLIRGNILKLIVLVLKRFLLKEPFLYIATIQSQGTGSMGLKDLSLGLLGENQFVAADPIGAELTIIPDKEINLKSPPCHYSFHETPGTS